MSYESLLIDEMNVQRLPSPTSQDTIGGASATYATVSSDNPCRIRLLSATERTATGRDGVISTHRMYCEPGVDVTSPDQVVRGSDNFDVNYVNDVDNMGHHKQVDMTLRE